MRLLNYELGQRLGKGGFGEVYLARDTALDIDVAVKILLPLYAASEDMVERFRLGARAAANLQHPNIIRVLYLGEMPQDQMYFTAMEYLPGGTLADKIDRGMPLESAVKAFVKIAKAVDFAHQKGIIHRDIKPANIMFRADGEPVVVDFDFSRILGGQRLTTDGTAYGTLRYLSPEQAGGEDVSPESDIYSLGIMLFEMVTGRLPYDDPDIAEMLNLHLYGPTPRPSDFKSSLPPQLDTVIGKAMAKPRDARYSSGVEFAKALTNAYYGSGSFKSTHSHDKDAFTSIAQYQLTFLNGTQQGHSVPLARSPFRVGFSEDDGNDLGLEDDYVSMEHGLFELDGEDWVYVDLNSRNGSCLVGDDGRKRKLRPETPHRLELGEVLEIGDTLLRFEPA
jgi:serine/threonine protein kinase